MFGKSTKINRKIHKALVYYRTRTREKELVRHIHMGVKVKKIPPLRTVRAYSFLLIISILERLVSGIYCWGPGNRVVLLNFGYAATFSGKNLE